jgi:addiction module HigA family antidote
MPGGQIKSVSLEELKDKYIGKVGTPLRNQYEERLGLDVFHFINKKIKAKNIHPGKVLLDEFLIPFNITTYRLAKDIQVPQTRVYEIIKGNQRITADTAIRLSKYFGNSVRFWPGLQNDFDIEKEKLVKWEILKSIKSFKSV